MIAVTRRAGCLIPTRRVIRCQGKLEKWGRRHIDDLKDLKSKTNIGSSIQISIWLHFRIELDAKHMPAGRNLTSIDFIQVETPKEGLHIEAQKSDKFEKIDKIEKIMKFLIFIISRCIFSLKWYCTYIRVTRRAGC